MGERWYGTEGIGQRKEAGMIKQTWSRSDTASEYIMCRAHKKVSARLVGTLLAVECRQRGRGKGEDDGVGEEAPHGYACNQMD